jgi:hypothetical protein
MPPNGKYQAARVCTTQLNSWPSATFPAWRSSIGHFYFAQIGHDHFAPAFRNNFIDAYNSEAYTHAD